MPKKEYLLFIKNNIFQSGDEKTFSINIRALVVQSIVLRTLQEYTYYAVFRKQSEGFLIVSI